MGVIKFFDDQNVGSHKMTTVCLFEVQKDQEEGLLKVDMPISACIFFHF